MQLPRGTFREIRKTVTIDSLVHSLEGERYTGLATISSRSLNGTLVFKHGKFILIKFQNIRGDAAVGELRKSGSEVVDAALSLLGEAQIELALEFNKPCRVARSGSSETPASSRPAMHGTHEPARAVPERKPVIPGPAAKPAGNPARSPSPHPPARVPATAAPSSAPAVKAGGPEGDADTSFEDDLATIESMDLDTVTDKIRTDCKSMIKQLHLDHLMER